LYAEKKFILYLTVVLLLVSIAIIGCSEDDPAAPNDSPTYPAATHPDTLISNLIRAYEAMDHDAYADMLHANYVFDPVGEGGYWGFPATWDRVTELDIARNMFDGLPGEDPDTGAIKPGIQSISINTLIRQSEWASVPPEDTIYSDAQYAHFDAFIVFTLEGGENTMTVSYDQVFFVREVIGKSNEESIYQIVGHREIRSYLKGNEDNSWSVIKSIYMSQTE